MTSEQTDRNLLQVVLAGPPCSGKSTIGVWLARTLPGIHIEVDALLTLLLPDSDRRLEHRLHAYEVAAINAKSILSRGSNVILDCTYSRREARQYVLDNLNFNVRLIVVEFSVSPGVAVGRFIQRPAHHATDLTPEIVRNQAELYPYGYGTTLVNSEWSLEEIQSSVMKAIEAGHDFDPDRWARSGR